MSPLPLQQQLQALGRLQEVDLKIEHLKKLKLGHPAQNKERADRLSKLQSGVAAQSQIVATLEKQDRETRAGQELNQDRLTRAAAKLESVADGHQYQAATKELEQLRKVEVVLAGQFLRFSGEFKTASEELAKRSSEFEKLQAECTAKSAELTAEIAKIDQQMAELDQQRQPFATQIEKRIVTQYDRVRGARAGLGAVYATGGRCSGCNMAVPPQLYIQLQKALELLPCPSCMRIFLGASDAKSSS